MLNRRNLTVFIAALGLVFGMAGLADAAHTKAHKRSGASSGEMRGGPGKPEMILQGPVLSVNPTTGFIVIRHGAGNDAEEIPVEIDSKTSLTRAGKSATLDEVKTGDRVKVSYRGSPGDVSKTVVVAGGPSMRTGARRTSR
jgi:hypothetical protein